MASELFRPLDPNHAIIPFPEFEDVAGDVTFRECDREIDLVGAEVAFGLFMTALGYPPDDGDPHLADTPARVAKAYAEMLTPHTFKATTFEVDEADGNHEETFSSEPTHRAVIMTGIPFVSFCAHHFLPFTGVAHVAYIPGERLVGLSKLARVVHHFAAMPQVQERLTNQIARGLQDALQCLGVAAILSARHQCMELRGVRTVGAVTTTTAATGIYAKNGPLFHEFQLLAAST